MTQSGHWVVQAPHWNPARAVHRPSVQNAYRTGWARRDRWSGMMGYGQFCSMARAHEVLGGRWTLLIVREILCGSRRFNDIRRGIPRISRTMLSERLQALLVAGAITRVDGAHGPEYALTEAGRELAILVGALAGWGQRWLKREAKDEDLDLEPVLVDMQRRV